MTRNPPHHPRPWTPRVPPLRCFVAKAFSLLWRESIWKCRRRERQCMAVYAHSRRGYHYLLFRFYRAYDAAPIPHITLNQNDLEAVVSAVPGGQEIRRSVTGKASKSGVDLRGAFYENFQWKSSFFQCKSPFMQMKCNVYKYIRNSVYIAQDGLSSDWIFYNFIGRFMCRRVLSPRTDF